MEAASRAYAGDEAPRFESANAGSFGRSIRKWSFRLCEWSSWLGGVFSLGHSTTQEASVEPMVLWALLPTAC